MSKVVFDKWLIRMGIAIFSLFVITIIVGDVLGNRHYKAMVFAGVVDSVTYDIKDYPTVFINNDKFLLADPSWG